MGTKTMLEVYLALNHTVELPGPAEVAEYAHHCRAAGLDTPLQGSEDFFRALWLLNQARTGPGATPALPMFLELVAEDLGFRLGPRDSPSLAAAGSGGMPELRVVQLRLEEDGAPSPAPRYRISGACYAYRDGVLKQLSTRDPTDPFARDELVDRGSEVVSEWGEVAPTRRGVTMRFEFLLPWSLLDHAPDLWRVSEYVLGHRFPVVIRSLDRYQNPWMHEPWLERWQHITCAAQPGGASAADDIGWLALADGRAAAPGASSCRWPPLRFRTAEEVSAWLRKHPPLACLGLAFGYDNHDPAAAQAVKQAIVHGVPALLWRRDGGDPSELDSSLRDPSPSFLEHLPVTVHQLRNAAADAPEHDVRRHVSLLWDDPYCVARAQDKSFPGMSSYRPPE
ncbi:hypothetical protein [Streptomyces sp. NPDC060065]|uniref:VMAP-C domain-containing protein n=1 Tax=Streptomyces sp. NPDC060065 TaxID=3347050 RepID=UPI0036A5CDB3